MALPFLPIPEGGQCRRIETAPDGSFSRIEYRLAPGERSGLHSLNARETWKNTGETPLHWIGWSAGVLTRGELPPGETRIFLPGEAFAVAAPLGGQALCETRPAFEPQMLRLCTQRDLKCSDPVTRRILMDHLSENAADRCTVMTFNIQHGLDYAHGQKKIDLPLMAQVIRDSGARIVGLNEVRDYADEPESRDQAGQLGRLLGYESYFAQAIEFGEGKAYGNALLSAYPILEAQTIPIPDPPVKDEDAYYETRCLLRARLDAPGGLTVLICHFGLAKAEEKNAADTILATLDTVKGPVILMGDFNIQPEDPQLLRLSRALQDSARYFTRPSLSYPSDRPEIKIDYIFTRDLTVKAAAIPPMVASDHRPHTAEIEF